jgi:octaprenyl-diphosphate synthase
LEAVVAAQQLGEIAAPDRVGERAASRLVELRAIFAADLAHVEQALADTSHTGPEPATQAASHLFAAGGKRIRPLCVLLSAACVGRVSSVTRELAIAAELVHLATLLHDDVVDDADLRRGSVAARCVWGNAVSVLAGDLLLTHALERTVCVAPGRATSELLRTLRKLVDGEVVQLRGRTGAASSEATYLGIIEDKTASLFTWAARAGARSGGASERDIDTLGEVGRDVGIAFQLVDDALDYAGDATRTGKDLLADLGEGKLTLPLLIALRARPELAVVVERTRRGEADGADAMSEILATVRAARGSEQTRDRAIGHTRNALAALASLPPSPARDLYAALATELTRRAE